MRQIIIYLALAFLTTLSFSSCKEDDKTVINTDPTKDIVTLAQENGFTSLAEALTKAGLVDDLQAEGSMTVFAPTNAAFDALLLEIGQTSISDIPASVLQEILLYHVVNSKVLSSEVTAGDVTTLEGTAITLATDGGITVNGANVIAPFDVEATNGIIHTIDQVLVPSSVAQFVNTVLEPAYFSDNFTTLIAAASKAELVSTLLSTPNLTIFAPTNEAFTKSGIDPTALSKEQLVPVLTYHVLSTKVLSKDIPRMAPTLNTANLYFSLVSAGNFINGSTEIKMVDIESGTGVVHVIDAVILPPVGDVVETAVSISSNGDFKSLVAALLRTENEGNGEQKLITALKGMGPYTVFAPNDMAFQALLDGNEEWTTLNDIPLETLVEVLSYHVVPARGYDKDLEGSVDMNNELPTLLGQPIKIDLMKLMVNDASIDVTNVHASNGVIHSIKKVLIPAK